MGHDHDLRRLGLERSVFVVALLLATATAVAVTEAARAPVAPPASRAEALLDLLARGAHTGPTRVEIAPGGETVLVLTSEATWRYRKSPSGWLRDRTGPVTEAALADAGVVFMLDESRSIGGVSIWRPGAAPAPLGAPDSSGQVKGLVAARDGATAAAWVVADGRARLARWSVNGPVADSGFTLDREQDLPQIAVGPGGRVAFADLGRVALGGAEGRNSVDGDGPVWFWPDGRLGFLQVGTVVAWDGQAVSPVGAIPGAQPIAVRVGAGMGAAFLQSGVEEFRWLIVSTDPWQVLVQMPPVPARSPALAWFEGGRFVSYVLVAGERRAYWRSESLDTSRKR